jgi:hypothetical protein
VVSSICIKIVVWFLKFGVQYADACGPHFSSLWCPFHCVYSARFLSSYLSAFPTFTAIDSMDHRFSNRKQIQSAFQDVNVF